MPGVGGYGPINRVELKNMVAAWCTDPQGDLADTKGTPIGEWDISEITSLEEVFRDYYTCNPDVSKWNTSKVTNMFRAFQYARAFNGNVSGWDTSKVTTMHAMFVEAALLNQDLSAWPTGNVVGDGMEFMFGNATTQLVKLGEHLAANDDSGVRWMEM